MTVVVKKNRKNVSHIFPATDFVIITPSDTDDLADACRSFYVGNAGDVKVTSYDGTTGVIPNIQAGTVFPLSVTRIWSTLTTASGIVALY